MKKKEDTPQRIVRRKYEAEHATERKEKNKVWGTSIERRFAEEIDEFLKENRLSKVELIKAGFKTLQQECGPKKIE